MNIMTILCSDKAESAIKWFLNESECLCNSNSIVSGRTQSSVA